MRLLKIVDAWWESLSSTLSMCVLLHRNGNGLHGSHSVC